MVEPSVVARTPRALDRVVARGSAATPVLAAAAVALWVLAVRQADFASMGVLGLASILHASYFAGLALVAVGLGLELLRPRLRPWMLGVLTVLLITYVYATASAIEPTAALTSSYVHAGYVQYILTHGHSLNNFAAEFSWPGGFSLGALLVAVAGQHDALGMLRWFPPFIELLCLLPLLAIARASGVSRRAGWLAIAIFYSSNWIYQDYFSPQAMAYFLYLGILAAVLSCWRGVDFERAATTGLHLRERLADTRRAARLRRLGGYDATTDWSDRAQLGMLGTLALLALAIAIGHQLTPYALVAALLACLLTRRLGRPELAIVVGLFAIGWLSLGASNYWVGHLGDIFRGIGALGALVSSNVANRVTGSASHQRIVEARILLTAAVLGLAGIGAVRRATSTRTLELLAAAPFFLLFFQNYGGEGLLRVVLFSLPFTSLLAAEALLPSRRGAIRPFVPTFGLGRHGRTVLAALCAMLIVVLSFSTTVVRGGNDAYEAYSLGELAAVDYVYVHALNGQQVAMIAPYLPIDERRVGDIRLYVVAANGSTPTQGQLLPILRKDRPEWIILGHAQDQWGQILAGYPQGWEDTLERQLLRHGYRIAAQYENATVLQRVGR